MGQSIQLADSLLQSGERFYEDGNMRQAEFYYREAYHLYGEFQDTASWLEAGKGYAGALMYRSKTDQAINTYSKLLGVDHPTNNAYSRGNIYNSMGLASNRVGKLKQAFKYYKKSLPLAIRSGDSLLIGVIYDNIGGNYFDEGKYSKSVEYRKKALPYFKGLGNKKSIAITLNNIGLIYEELSLYEKALEFYTQSLKIREELENVNLLSTIYDNIAGVQQDLGNYDQALVAFQKSLQYSRQAGTPASTARILNNIGLLYKNLGELDKARAYYRQSLAIKEETSGPQAIAATSRNLGKLLWEQGKTKEAAGYIKKALALRKKVGNPYDIASSLKTMVQLELEARNFREAQDYAEQINAIGDSTGSNKILSEASTFFGNIYAAKGNDRLALQHYKKAYVYSQSLPATKQLEPLKNLAVIHNKLSSNKAVRYGQKAVDIIEKSRSNAGKLTTLRAGYFQQHTDFYTRLASWVLKYRQDTPRAFHLVELAKARALSDELAKASQNIGQQLPEEVWVERNQKKRNIDALYSTLENTADPQQQAQIKQEIRLAELAYAAFENKIHEQYPELKSLQSPQPITLDLARELTDEQTAVLEYAVAGNQLIMFLISRETVRVKQFSLGKNQPLAAKLTSLVAGFKDAILSNAPRPVLQAESGKLYNGLIKPFEDELTRYSNLIIVPDGALAYLPFEALSQGDQYLIENFNIKYEPSLTSLTLLQETEAVDHKQLLAVAGSNISGSQSIFQRQSFSALPSTITEVDSIASHFQQVSTLKNAEVSEQAFKTLVRQNRYRYVHLATHGVIDETYPSRSGLALSSEGELEAASKEDGMLRSSEIFGLNINSDMVVLSACNTGLGKVVKGEGMLGLQRSFFYAGASTVVVSLWNVYDRSTASFMNEFYKALLRISSEQSWMNDMLRSIGWDESLPFGSKASAMRQAKLQMIRHPLFNHPIYWAPFIVVGR